MTDERFDSTVTTTCGYCGVGCRLEAHTRARPASSRSAPPLDGPANRGHTCLKGRFAHQFSRSRDRLTTPLIREGGELRAATWDEATAAGSRRSSAASGPSTGRTRSPASRRSRATNEDCYAMQRLMRAAIGTNNIDNCSRVCHSPTSLALRKSLGSPARPARSTTSTPPTRRSSSAPTRPRGTRSSARASSRRRCAALRLVTIDPRRIELADYGVVHLSPRPGTNAAVMLGLAHVARRDGLVDRAFVDARTEGFGALRAAARAATTRRPSRRSPASRRADLERAAHIYGEAGEACILWGLGVTEHKYGSEVVQLICTLALMTGKVGRPRRRRCCRCAGRTTSRARPTWARCRTPTRATARVDDEEVAQAFEARWGVRAVARAGPEDPADVRRRGRRRR